MTRSLNIHWLVQGIETDSEGRPTSDLASNRYRVLTPASWLEAHQNHVKLLSAGHWKFDAANSPDILLVGKMLPGGKSERVQAFTSQLLHHIRFAREAGIPVIADFNDDHFQHPLIGAYWRELAAISTICIAGSTEMANLLKSQTEQPIRVIGDPIGSPFAEPKVFNALSPSSNGFLSRFIGTKKTPQRYLNFAWYGNPVNWPSLQVWIDQLAALAQRQPFRLWALTRISPTMQKYVDQFNATYSPAAVIELQEWNEQDQWDVVRDADVVLVPSDTSDSTKRVKTSNRLTDALHMGRTVMASHLPEYIPYADATWLTDRPLDTISDILAMPDTAMRKIISGQQMVSERCSPDEISKQWLNCIDEAIRLPNTGIESLSLDSSNRNTADLIRLNLGCGDKILPGYVNVDVVEARAGKTPDVLCDLHQLHPFPDNYADEVMAIHVVEHFWRWEVEDILREWIRVLRPGGRMVLECPNLISACEEFLKNTELRSRPDQAGQRTMWVFYGDPSWKDPYMIHRWGYTPDSLKRLMESVGLIKVVQEPAQYKLKEPRDMRLVGYKFR